MNTSPSVSASDSGAASVNVPRGQPPADPEAWLAAVQKTSRSTDAGKSGKVAAGHATDCTKHRASSRKQAQPTGHPAWLVASGAPSASAPSPQAQPGANAEQVALVAAAAAAALLPAQRTGARVALRAQIPAAGHPATASAPATPAARAATPPAAIARPTTANTPPPGAATAHAAAQTLPHPRDGVLPGARILQQVTVDTAREAGMEVLAAPDRFRDAVADATGSQARGATPRLTTTTAASTVDAQPADRGGDGAIPAHVAQPSAPIKQPSIAGHVVSVSAADALMGVVAPQAPPPPAVTIPPAAAAGPVTATIHVAADANAKALAVAVGAMVQGGLPTATVALTPPALGHVQVQVQVNADHTAALVFTVAQPAAAQVIQSGLPALAQALQQANLVLARADIGGGSVGTTTWYGQQHRSQQQGAWSRDGSLVGAGRRSGAKRKGAAGPDGVMAYA